MFTAVIFVVLIYDRHRYLINITRFIIFALSEQNLTQSPKGMLNENTTVSVPGLVLEIPALDK